MISIHFINGDTPFGILGVILFAGILVGMALLLIGLVSKPFPAKILESNMKTAAIVSTIANILKRELQ